MEAAKTDSDDAGTTHSDQFMFQMHITTACTSHVSFPPGIPWLWLRRAVLLLLMVLATLVLLVPSWRHDFVYYTNVGLRQLEITRVQLDFADSNDRHFAVFADSTPIGPCVVKVDYPTQTIRVGGPADCNLFRVQSTQADDYVLWRQQNKLERRAPLRSALLKVTSSFKFLDYYDAGIMSACMYSDLHGIPLFLYRQTKHNDEHWQNVLMPRVEGLRALFASDKKIDTVLLSDLDTKFDMTPSPAFHVDALIDRMSPRASFIIQGEQSLCACVWIMRRSDAAFALLDDNEQQCALARYCSQFPYEQTAWFHLILRGINNTHGYRFPSDACTQDGNEPCQRKLMSDLSRPEIAALDWGAFAFVPQNGTTDAPMLHNCRDFWNGCRDLPSILYHSSHWHWHQYRTDVLHYLRLRRPIP